MAVSHDDRTVTTEAPIGPFRKLAAAVRFLTCLPLPATWVAEGPVTPAVLVFFPFVGTFIGLVVGVTIWLASHVWPMGVAVIVGLVIEALITGAIHEDALADCCDALGGGWTRDDVLRILGDSHIGAFGTLGLVLVVGLKAAALATMPETLVVAAVIASATWGRWTMVSASAMLPPVGGRSSLAAHLAPETTRRLAPLSGLLTLPGLLPLVWMAPSSLLPIGLTTAVILPSFVIYIRRRIGGMTGDCLGCLCLMMQVVVLLAIAARANP